MYTRQQIKRKTLSNSASKSVQTSLFQQRPFNEQANPAAASSHQQEQPDLQTQLDRATRFGHNFSQVQVNADTPSSVIQPKLAIGAPGDKYEQEADQMAAQVMSIPAPLHQQSIQREMAPEELEEEAVQTKPLAASITPLIQREMAPEPEEEEQLQTKPLAGSMIQREMAPEPEEEQDLQTKPLAGSTIQREMAPESEEEEQLQTKRSPDGNSQTSSNLESQLSASKGGGSSLSEDVRSFMEPRFGADFSQVRVHTDSQAVQMNKELGAQAFTHGHDIYFGEGKSPGISDLTAHELTHVVQQGAARKNETIVQNKSLHSKHDNMGTSLEETLSKVHQTGTERVQRDGGATAAATGLALAGLGLVQNQVNTAQGNLSYSSDQITYPKDLNLVESTARPIAQKAAYFFSPGAFSDNKTTFMLHGNFSDRSGSPVMANVYIDLDETTTYSHSALSFNAKAHQTPYGTPENPKIRFTCTGRFDPAGIGDCSYRVVLEVNKYGHVSCVEHKIINGKGSLIAGSVTGFSLIV